MAHVFILDFLRFFIPLLPGGSVPQSSFLGHSFIIGEHDGEQGLSLVRCSYRPMRKRHSGNPIRVVVRDDTVDLLEDDASRHDQVLAAMADLAEVYGIGTKAG